jgi:hypothetical protein
LFSNFLLRNVTLHEIFLQYPNFIYSFLKLENLKRTSYLQSLKIKLLEEELRSRGIPLPAILQITKDNEEESESSDRHNGLTYYAVPLRVSIMQYSTLYAIVFMANYGKLD